MANEAAFPGPYVDTNITKRNVVNVSPPEVLPVKTANDQAATKVYDVAGTNHEPGDQGAVTPPQAGSSWVYGRDPYKVGGAVGQEFFNNQG